MIITSLLEEHPTLDLVNSTRESTDQITREIAELRENFNKLNNEIWDTVTPMKADVGGSGMVQK